MIRLVHSILVTLILLASFPHLPPYRSWRERRAAGRAVAYLAQSNYPSASISARQALNFNSNNIAACKVMAELAERTRAPSLLAWRQRLLQLQPDDPTNKIGLARAALTFGQLPLARQLLRSVPDPTRSAPEYHDVAARLAFAARDLQGAQEHLARAAELDCTNLAHRANLEIVRLHAADSNIVRDARQALDEAWPGSDQRVPILRALVTEALTRHDLARARALAEQLHAQPDVEFQDRLLHLSVLRVSERQSVGGAGDQSVRASEGQRVGVSSEDNLKSQIPSEGQMSEGGGRRSATQSDRVSEGQRVRGAEAQSVATGEAGLPAVAPRAEAGDRRSEIGGRTSDIRHPTSASPPEPGKSFTEVLAETEDIAAGDKAATCQLARWLLERGLAQQTLDWIETLPPSARIDTCVRMAETECYIATGKWTELLELLEERYWGPDDHLRHAALALIHRQRGDDGLARIEWKRAVRAAAGADSAVLVGLAGRWQWEKEAEELLWQLAREDPDAHWALALLRRAYEISGDTRSLWRVYDLMVTRRPRDLVAKNNFASACLLLRTNLVQAHQFAHEVFLAEPANPSFVCTRAYSLHLQERTEDALALMSKLSKETLSEPAMAAYYSLLLRAAGNEHDASDYAALAQRGPLLPEEGQLLLGN